MVSKVKETQRMLRFSGAGHSGSCHHPWGCRGQGEAYGASEG